MNAITTAPIGMYRVGYLDRPVVAREGSKLLPVLLVALAVVGGAWAYALMRGGLPFVG